MLKFEKLSKCLRIADRSYAIILYEDMYFAYVRDYIYYRYKPFSYMHDRDISDTSRSYWNNKDYGIILHKINVKDNEISFRDSPKSSYADSDIFVFMSIKTFYCLKKVLLCLR